MRAKIAMLLTFLAAAGCAAGPAPPPRPAASVSALPSAPAGEEARPRAPAETLAAADQAYDSQLGALRGGHYDTERQIGVLKQAVLLYGQFLERAEGRPELEPAVRKSRERIADAQETIAFLEASLRAQDEPPPARDPYLH
jgi:hypothetical protein